MASSFSFLSKNYGASAPASRSSDQNTLPPPTELPWIEKYRPKSIDDIAAQSQVVQVLRATIESQNLPHLLFYGPPGTGKTSTILALSRDMFGPELYRTRVMELNASDERGIDVVREKVKTFAKVMVDTNTTTKINGVQKRVPPYKIIVLDEADSMTTDAQAALRRTMEKFSTTTRFCLICNYVSRIIGPLASRCAKFRFASLDEDESRNRISMIAQNESLNIGDEALGTLIKVSEGDLRRAIMLMQSASYLMSKNASISSHTLMEIGGVIPQEHISSFTSLWREPGQGNAMKATSVVKELIKNGYSATQLIRQLFPAFVSDSILSPSQKSRIALVMGRVDMCLNSGADEHLQLMDLALECCRIASTQKLSCS